MSTLAYRHQRVQRLRRLLGRRNARQEEGRFVVEGANLLEEALRARVPIEAVYLDAAWARPGPPAGLLPVAGEAPGSSPGGEGAGGGRGGEAAGSGASERLKTLVDRCYDLGARVFELEPGVLARVAGTVTPQPVMAVMETPAHTLTDVGARHPQLVVVCVDVRDPGNAGTVVRSAWAAGADAVVCCEGTVDIWNPKAVRSSAGAVLHLPVVTAGPPASTLEEIGRWGLRRWATVSAGGEDYASAQLTQPGALIMGNEASGLPVAELASYLDGLLTIPMAGGAVSLNVGMATAVLCFEAARQRRQQPSSVPPDLEPARRG